MFDQKITIELVARNPLTLKLVGPDGLDPKFTMLAVSDVGTEETIWWIVAAPEDAVWCEVPPESVSVGELVPLEEADPADVRWIEQKTAEHFETTPAVGTITYGVAPRGFHLQFTA